MELVTFSDLAERFPMEGYKNSCDTWGKILRRFRDEKKLLERRGPDCPKWHYRMMMGKNGTQVRHYKLYAVVVCICREAQGEKPRPLTSYLCDRYYKEFCVILQEEKEEARKAIEAKAYDQTL